MHAAAAVATWALSLADRAELHGGRHVDDQPGGEVAVGDLLAYVCLAVRAVMFQSMRRTSSPG